MRAPAAALGLALLGLVSLSTTPAGAAVFEPRDFPSEEHRERYKSLISELRCLVCQNQNLADSNADLATDLRRQTYQMIVAGRSDEEIVDFMVARYGDFVLYRPPFKTKTLLLWLGPGILCIGGLFTLFVHLRRRRREAAAEAPLGADERQRLREILGKE